MKSSLFVTLAAALAFASGAASAVQIAPVQIKSPALTGGAFSNVTIGTITLASLSSVTGSFFAASSAAVGTKSFTLQPVTFTLGGLVGQSDTDPTGSGFSYASLAAGTYTLQASGTLGAVGQLKNIAFVGADYAVTPVPEPETYALMLAGLGAVGFVVARRRPRV